MANKSNKSLLLLFAVLLGIFLLSKVFDFGKKPQKSFRTELTNIDSSSVGQIVIYPKAGNHNAVIFEKSNEGWFLTNGNIKSKLDPNVISGLIDQVQNIKVKRLVATSKDQWVPYEVTDSLGSRIVLYSAPTKIIADLTVGKFNFQQQPQAMQTYLRLTEEEQVYMIDGFLSMAINRKFDDWRNKQLVKINTNNISKLSWNINGQNQSIQKNGSQWSGMKNPIDSARVATYLSQTASLQGSAFADDYTPQGNPMSLTFEGNNMNPLEVKCYPDNNGFILTSSINPASYFRSDSMGLYKTLFEDLAPLNN